MDRRYTILVHDRDVQIQNDCPVILKAYAITKDNKEQKYIAQCKFENLACKTITGLYITVWSYGADGKQIDNGIDFTYAYLDADQYNEFGDKNAIGIKNNYVTKLGIQTNKIIFSDGECWERQEQSQYEKVQLKAIDDELGELKEQYNRDLAEKTNHKISWVCEQRDGMVLCGCGTIYLNQYGRCPNCYMSFKEQKDLLNKEALQEHLLQWKEICRKRQEQLEYEQREKFKQEFLKNEKSKKARHRFFCIVAVICIIILLGVISWGGYLNSQYQKAGSYLASGNYDAAETIYLNLGDYKDSATLATETVYQKACWFQEQGYLQEAVVFFETLNSYKDSDDRIDEIENVLAEQKNELAEKEDLYQRAIRLYNRKYRIAYTYFEELGDYKDSQQYLQKIKESDWY